MGRSARGAPHVAAAHQASECPVPALQQLGLPAHQPALLTCAHLLLRTCSARPAVTSGTRNFTCGLAGEIGLSQAVANLTGDYEGDCYLSPHTHMPTPLAD